MPLKNDGAWSGRIVGLHEPLPLLDGRLAPYIHLDNAASTPPFRDVVDAVQHLLPYYSSVHRGAGFKSRVCTAAYDDAHRMVATFVGADPETSAVIFGKNATEAINKLAHRFPLPPGSVVISTEMEHHSNDLPWRGRAHVARAHVTTDGCLDEDHFDRLLAKHGRHVAMVTVCGASNVTGFVQPIHRLASKAHRVGAKILVDAAQLAPHRRIDVKPDDDPEHLDFVAISAHKMYAPFGTGALIGCRDVFAQGEPEYRGGGTVDVVTPRHVTWAGLPDREEAGTPNLVGAVAMAVAARTLTNGDFDAIASHERALTAYALDRLRALPGVTLYGHDRLHADQDRVGVISFNLAGVPHALVASILGYEAGIGVRSGCFCAQGYASHLLKLSAADRARARRITAARHADRPGMVRISFGAYNTAADVDAALDRLTRIAAGDYAGRYEAAGADGDYQPIRHDDAARRHFSLAC